MTSSLATTSPPTPFRDARFRLGDATIDPPRNRIERAGRETRVEPKVMRVLTALAEHADRVLTRAQLIEAVWGDAAVGEEVLTRAISELRRTLADDPKHPRYIETVYKTGYRLIARPASADCGAREDGEPIDAPSHRGPMPRPDRSRRVLLQLLLVASVAVLAWIGARRAGSQRSAPENPDTLYPFAVPAESVRIRPFDPSALTPVTSFPGHEFYSPFSPDGKAISLVWEGPDGGTQYDLWILSLDEAEPHQLTETPAFEDDPTWHPSGDRIAYVRNGTDGGIFMRPLLGGSERRLLDTRFGRIHGISFAPDGRHLVLSAGEPSGAPARLYQLELATRNVVSLTEPPADSEGDFSPVWSPDGRWIAFDRLQGPLGDQDIHLLPVPEGPDEAEAPIRRLTHDRRYVSGKAWMADSASLVYAGSRSGFSQLWQLELDGTVHPLSGSLSRLMSPAVSRQGDRLSFTRKVVEHNIWRVPVVGDALPEPLIVSTQMDLSPSYSPDGSRIAFVSYRSGHPELWSSDRAGRNLVRLTHFKGPLVRLPRWSPDGQELMIEIVRPGRTELQTVSVDGGPARLISPSGANEAYGSWSADGRFIVYASDRSGSWQVWQRTASGGEAQQLTETGGSASFLTEHGLFYTKPHAAGIWHRTVNSEREFVQTLPHALAAQWLVHGDGLYYIDNSQHPHIRRRDIVTGSETEILSLERIGWDDQIFSIDPQGQSIAFGQADRVESDIWMVELQTMPHSGR